MASKSDEQLAQPGEEADYDRVVQVWSASQGSLISGSGYLLTGDVVLTAARFATDTRGPEVQVRRFRSDDSTPGRVIWSDQRLDVALVVLRTPIAMRLVPPKLDVEIDERGLAFEAVGFPYALGDHKPPELVRGTAFPDSEAPGFLRLVLFEDNPRTSEASVPAFYDPPGAVGAALLHGQSLLGVMIPSGRLNSQPRAVAAKTLSRIPGFNEALAHHAASQVPDTSDQRPGPQETPVAESVPPSDSELPPAPPPDTVNPPIRPRDQVEWVSDAPADRDLLNRAPIATMIARRLRRLVSDGEKDGHHLAGSFLVHLDGPWGAGKTSLLNFLRADLQSTDEPWLVVDVNAWQQASLGPAWWTLLTGLRRRLSEDLDMTARVRLRMAEGWRRGRVARAPYLLAVVLALILGAALVLAVGPGKLASADASKVASAITAIIAAAGAVWAALLLVSRFFLWDSPAGARLFEQSNRDAKTFVREHFAWLIDRAGRPVVFFVDDLDRCEREYVVELLDGIQTLVRDAGAIAGEPPPVGTDRRSGGPFFIVAADGCWIRACYQREHQDLADAVGHAGQSLGYLFLEKLFQLTVSVPALSAAMQARFVQSLLSPNAAGDASDDGDRDTVETALKASTTQGEVQRAWRRASGQVREEVAALAVEKLTEPAVETATEHDLQKFAVLLDRNPRRIKRFLNTYTANLVTTAIEQSFPDPDSLALWTIVRMRWPTLADLLADDASAISGKPHDTGDAAKDGDGDLFALMGRPEFTAVRDFKPGGPLTHELIETLTGTAQITPSVA